MTQNIRQAFVDNPIVLRDLRSTMRGTRAFWFQGAYLFLLGVLAVTGFGLSTGQDLLGGITGRSGGDHAMSIVDAQSRLQSFYYFIFATLAGLICLIAPALTATSVSDERQRQSLDLLTTTPLSATELLVGKLMSSLAFLGVLLALSLPASALCVLLGGATLGDLFRVYTMLAIDAVVLASIGLYFSCACKNSLHALVWTYGAVIAFVGVTYMMFMVGTNGSPSRIADLSPIAAVGALSPFAAIYPTMGQSIVIGAVKLPVLLAMLPAAFAVVRLLLTAAAYRFGMFGAEPAHSLRKQLLAFAGLVALTFGFSVVGQNGMIHDTGSGTGAQFVAVMTAFLVAGMTPFLPGLFVPVKAEDAPPGEAQTASDGRDVGAFRLGAMLLPRHAGALPFYFAFLIAIGTGFFAGVALSKTDTLLREWAFDLGFAFVYASGVGLLVWGASRFAARRVRAASAARALAFGIIVLAALLPCLPLSLFWNESWKDFPGVQLWLGSPMLYSSSDADGSQMGLFASGAGAAIVGLLLGLLNKPKAE